MKGGKPVGMKGVGGCKHGISGIGWCRLVRKVYMKER